MKNLSLVAGITALVSLLTVIIVTPAMAAPKRDLRATVTPWGTVILPVDRITVKPCKVRALDQGSGNVRICE